MIDDPFGPHYEMPDAPPHDNVFPEDPLRFGLPEIILWGPGWYQVDEIHSP